MAKIKTLFYFGEVSLGKKNTYTLHNFPLGTCMSSHSPGRGDCCGALSFENYIRDEDSCEDFSGGYDDDDNQVMCGSVEICDDEAEFLSHIPELSKENFTVFEDQRLGGGAHGQVFRGLYNNQYVAVKRISSRSFEQLRREVSVLTKFSTCPYIIDVIGVCTTTHELILPLKENGSLRDHLRRHTLPFLQKKLITTEILNGLISLHLDGRVHGDISSVNVLIDREGHACLCDFNLSKYSNESSTFGNLVYSAPENYDPFALYTTKSDVFSFGLLLFEVFFPPSPFVDRTFHIRKEKISREFWSNPLSSVRIIDLLSFPEVRGEEAVMKSIILSCLQMLPSARPSIQQIANWFATSQCSEEEKETNQNFH
jgi:serine/threonine protein kinase